MNTYEIQTVLESDPIIKINIQKGFALDEFQSNIKNTLTEGIFVVNNKSKARIGNHWILIFVKYCKETFFIDSYARSPNDFNLLTKLEAKKCIIMQNTMMLQGSFSNVSRVYCIFVAYHLFRGKELKEILEHFTQDMHINDEAVRFVHNTFLGYKRSP